MGNFRILPLGMTGLRIEDPPTYWAAAFFILVFLVGFLVFSGSIPARLRPSEQFSASTIVSTRSENLDVAGRCPSVVCFLCLRRDILPGFYQICRALQRGVLRSLHPKFVVVGTIFSIS
jgi:hypothetical protein